MRLRHRHLSAAAPALMMRQGTPPREDWTLSDSTNADRGQPRPMPLVPFPEQSWQAAPLPVPLSHFVERPAEIAALRALLRRDGVRLVTLTGPGGADKPRLALGIARELAPGSADGVAFVALATVADAGLVPAAIAQAFDVREGSDQSLDQRLAAVLRERRMLLVLDNFEHVVSAAVLVADFLAACPDLTVLVTSRSTLRLSGEHAFPVPPLTFPDSVVTTADEARRSEAVQLFVQRAQAVRPSFALDDETAADIVDACRRLDGLPLAIELAAARVAVLPLPTLLTRLDRALPLVTGGPQDTPTRLRTMRNAIAWSYDLLVPSDQSLFRRLAVFSGSCTIEAAQAVTGVAVDILDGISSLVTSSMLRPEDGPGGEPRYSMLATIREFGLELLAGAGELEGTLDAHANYFGALDRRLEPNHLEPLERFDHRLLRIEADHPNLRAALVRLQDVGNNDQVLRLASGLAVFWHHRGHLREGREWLEWALAHTAATPTRVRGWALAGLSLIAWTQNDPERAAPLAEAALVIARESGDTELAALSIHMLGMAELVRLRPDRAEPLMEEARRLWRVLGLASDEAFALDARGRVASGLGDDDFAASRAKEALAIFRRLDHTSGAAIALCDLGHLAMRHGDDHRAGLAYLEALDLFASIGERWAIVRSLSGLAVLASAHGQAEAAATLIGTIDPRLLEGGARIFPADGDYVDRAVAAVSAVLRPSRFAELRAAGQRMRLDEAVAAAAAVHVPPSVGRNDRYRLAPEANALTTRELEVLRLVAAGQTDRAIAEGLFLSRRTVNAHVARILAKLGVGTRREAAVRGREIGWLPSDEPTTPRSSP